MSDEKNPKIEPRWHKRDTLTKLREKRVEVRKKEVAIEEAEEMAKAMRADAQLLEREAVEWMTRDKTTTEVVLYPDIRKVAERQMAVVFTLNSYGGVHDTAVEPA